MSPTYEDNAEQSATLTQQHWGARRPRGMSAEYSGVKYPEVHADDGQASHLPLTLPVPTVMKDAGSHIQWRSRD